MREARTLSRDIQVAAIPYGDKIPLPAGSTVYVTQALGGSYTVMTDRGYMVRVEGQDADAIGEAVVAPAPASEAADKPVEQLAWDQLKTCFDPEIPVNIVDLGLVYGMEMGPMPDGTHKVDIKMTLTAQGCGMGATIAVDAKHKILTIPGISEANVDLVWDPPWNPQMISPEGRERLGID
jgi:probable FeS assembly SUF system protein SufT